jgi:AcrR family transcriptional regulator
MGHREALLIGARQCLEERGYARTTARDIVAASGTNLASIGYHFGSKEALLNEAIGAAFAEWTARVGEIAFAEAEAAPLDRLAASWTALLDSFAAHRPLLVAWVEALAQRAPTPQLRAQLAEQYQGIRDQVAALVEAAIGDLDGDAQALQHAASFFIAVPDGFIIQYLLDPERFPRGDDLMHSMGKALEAAVTAAATTPPSSR